MKQNETTLEILTETYCRQCDKRDYAETIEQCKFKPQCEVGAIQIYKEALGYYRGKK